MRVKEEKNIHEERPPLLEIMIVEFALVLKDFYAKIEITERMNDRWLAQERMQDEMSENMI